jgi:dihydrofolate synthase/folylpolyglutamate synthase
MVSVAKQPSRGSIHLGNQLSYQEVVELLTKNWAVKRPSIALETIKRLDVALGSPSKHLHTILVTGTNGKSLTLNYASRLLREEGLTVGTYFSPHILTYNERICVNQETVLNKAFADLANEVINTAKSLGIEAHSSEILLMIALLYFKQSNVDVALLEVEQAGEEDPTAICYPKITAITRVIAEGSESLDACIQKAVHMAQKDTHVVSADQSKFNLQMMADKVKERQAQWAMPIRKLAALNYPLEQLHGRCAALAERIAQLYVEHFAAKNATIISNSILIKPKGQRGRPSLEAKKQAELNPKRTIEQFWKEDMPLMGRFQLLDKEKPTVLLDNARNIDALKNLFLGIRLLHYQRPLKGLTLIIGAHKDSFETEEFLKLARYFFKKTSGSLIFFPVDNVVPATVAQDVWDVEKITNDVKALKIKARAAKNFKEAFELAKKSVDERHGLIVVTGSCSAINEYWNYKGIKKL